MGPEAESPRRAHRPRPSFQRGPVSDDAEYPFSGSPLQRTLEAQEVEMYRDLYAAVPPDLAEAWGLQAEGTGMGLRLTAAGFDHPFFNRIMGVGIGVGPSGTDLPAGGWTGLHRGGSHTPSREEWEDVLSSLSAHYARAGVRRWMLQLLPLLESEGFREAAAERGLVRLRGWAKHLGPSEPEVGAPSGLRIIRIGQDAGPAPPEHLARAWATIVCEAFAMPPGFVGWMERLLARDRWRLYLALDGDRPVASGALYLPPPVPGAPPLPAQLNFAGTLPAARGRGAQSALVARRLADARALGFRWITTETDEELPDRPNPSYRNMVRLGLPVRYVRANWGPPKPSAVTTGPPSPG